MSTEEIIAIFAEQMDRSFDVAFERELITRFTLWRARILRDSLEKRIQDRRFYRQTLYDDLQMAAMPTQGLTTREKVKFLRTKRPLPRPLRANNMLFDSVSNFKRTISYGYIDSHRINYLQYAQYSPNNKFFYLDDYLYVISDLEPEEIAIEGIWADPRELRDYLDPNGAACYRDSHYPIDPQLAQLAAEYVMRDISRNQPPEQPQEVTINK